MINYLPQKGFPFGNNIHFVYNNNSRQFIFLHSTIDWIMSGSTTRGIETLLARIEPEDVLYLQDIFTNVISGSFNGKITLKLRGNAGLRWLHITPLSGEYQGEKIIFGAVSEVTDEIMNIQSITKFTDKKNSILHMLGHDLRGPLNIARSLVKTVSREIRNPVLLEKTGYIATILQQSIDMISDLVRREFLETTSAELIRKRVDIVRLVADYIEECKRSEVLAGISFGLTSSASKIFVRLDDAKFMQIVNNLISNSLKFTPAGGAIQISIEEQAENVLFKFSDNGIGIPEALLPEIFEKFTPARRPGLQGEPTLGLGLSIVKTIVGWHQGRIICESKEGIGTTFLISFPKDIAG